MLVNTGAKVVINNLSQIKRDFTFGAGGGTLDLNDNDHTWNNGGTADGFTIHALTEEAIISNGAGHSTLTITNAGSEYLGSFQDSEGGSLKVVYDGGEGSTLAMHSIHTNLKSKDDSGFDVQSGTVVLSGTNTIHAMGSATGTNTDRLVNLDDWHYADAAMNVSVASGATFELGSHARLTGNVNVADGGTYIMREGVKHDQEYVEGGAVKEDVSKYSAFYGHHGDVSLASGAELQITYNEGVTAHNEYAGNITGDGNVTVALGNDGASLRLTGTNTFSGTKTVTSGVLVAEDVSALGATNNKWTVEESGGIGLESATGNDAVESFMNAHVDGDSKGTLVLQTNDRNSYGLIDMTNHKGMFVGAMKGCTIQYGTANDTLTAYDHDNNADTKTAWLLGGGGGTLVVNAKLEGDSDLILGTKNAKGVVQLTNTGNTFSGSIYMDGGVTLIADSSVLGTATVNLAYMNRLTAVDGTKYFGAGAAGVLLADKICSEDLNVSLCPNLTIGAIEDATLSGAITVAEGAAYRFGGTENKLTINTALTGEHGLVVDGQTYSGGTVHLAQATTITGAVSVMGYDEARSNGVTTGDITLQLAVNDALASASGVTLKAGATLDIKDTTQSLKSLDVQAGAIVRDSDGDGKLSVAGGSVAGSLQLGKLNVTGGNLALSGTTTVTDMNVNGGTVTLSGNGTSITNLKIGTGATFDINNANKSADSIGERISHVELAGGTLANTGDNIGAGSRQFYSLTLTADSSINSAKQFGLIGSGHGVTDIKLNNHTLTKNGAGQFDIYNTSITSGKVLVQGGSLYFSDNGKVHNSTIAASVMLDGGSFNVWKSGTGSLTFSGSQTQISTLTANAGSINFEAGSHQVSSSLSLSGGSLSLASGATLDLSAINIGGNAGVGMINKILNATTGAGTLKLQTSSQAGAAVLGASAEVHTNVQTDALYLNAWGNSGRVVALLDDSSLTVANELYVQSAAELHVAGGELSAKTITLGHWQANNTGTLELSSGSITTKSLKQANEKDTANVFTMTGGTLEFTQDKESAIAEGIQVNISGGTLKAAASSWYVDRAMTLGDVTIVAEGDNKIAFNGDVSVTAESSLKIVAEGDNKVAEGDNKIAFNGDVSVTTGSSLQIASEGISAKNLTLQDGAKIVVDLADFASAIDAREGDSVTLTILSGATITFGAEAVAVATALATADGTNYAQYLTVKDTSGKYSSFSSSWTYNKGTSLTLTVSVPEPSAFGLLAGISALVLCVSRRRRRK